MAIVTKTIGSAGDFATVQAWIDDIAVNSTDYGVGDTADGEVLESLAGIFTFNSAPAVAIAKAVLRPTDASRHLGVIGGGLRLSTDIATATLCDIGMDAGYDVDIQDLEFHLNPTGGTFFSSVGCRIRTNAIECTIKRCIFSNNGYTAASSGPTAVWGGFGRTMRVVRSLIVGFRNATTDEGYGALVGTPLLNCTIDGAAYGVDTNDGNIVVRNSISMASSVADYAATAGSIVAPSDKNMSSDATAPGTTTYPNETRALIWTDPDNGDYSLRDGTNAIGTGDDLGSTYEENIDITGTTVTGAWNLGAYHGDAGPGPQPTAAGPVLRVHGL